MTSAKAPCTPSLERFLEIADSGCEDLVPVSREVRADLETPVSAFLKVARGPYSFLLESVEGGERVARYSFIGTEPYDVIRTGDGEASGSVDPLVEVERALSGMRVAPQFASSRFDGGAVGYVSYDAAGHFERLPSPRSDALGLPESVFMLCDTYLVFDHVRGRVNIVSHARAGDDPVAAYARARERIDEIAARLSSPLDPATRPEGGQR